ncbi:MAG TPA: tryptophan synthase subunit alpha [Thermoanaerobaculia bacterium]|nr:tryptophan synthase subunit alpha [Thermoanaerobaculia bacterium]
MRNNLSSSPPPLRSSPRLAAVFEKASAENRAAFIAYLTAGDPSLEATVEMAEALERAGADVLELGVPFSDPIADGPVLQRAAERALAAGATLDGVLEIGGRIRRRTSLALVLFSYVNPLLRGGIESVARRAAEAGFDGALMTDLPPEEAGEYQPAVRSAGLDTVFLVSPTSTAARMKAAARLSSGFLYVVSRPGTTGARNALPADLPATIRRARKAAGSLPIAVGFGIGTPPAAGSAARLADGVIVGSALVAVAEAAEKRGAGPAAAVEKLARSLAEACRRNSTS